MTDRRRRPGREPGDAAEAAREQPGGPHHPADLPFSGAWLDGTEELVDLDAEEARDAAEARDASDVRGADGGWDAGGARPGGAGRPGGLFQPRGAAPGGPAAWGAGQPALRAWTEEDDADLPHDPDAPAGEGRLVRLYTLTGGRTRSAAGADLDLIAQVVAADRQAGGGRGDDLAPEHQAILELVRDRPLSVAEVAAGADLPVGITRVLLGDLIESGQVLVSRPVPPALLPDERILREVINGLRAL